MKREISCCVVTWIRLSLTLNTHFFMLYKKGGGVHLYTRHNLSPAHCWCLVSPFFKMLVDLMDKMKMSVSPSADEQKTAHLLWDHLFFMINLENCISLSGMRQHSVDLQLCPFLSAQIECFKWKWPPLPLLSSSVLHLPSEYEFASVKLAFCEVFNC